MTSQRRMAHCSSQGCAGEARIWATNAQVSRETIHNRTMRTLRFFGTARSISTFFTFSRGGTREAIGGKLTKRLHRAVSLYLSKQSRLSYAMAVPRWIGSSAGTRHSLCLSYNERYHLSREEECISVARSAMFPLFGVCQGCA